MRKGDFSVKKFILNNRNLPKIVINTGFKDDDGNNLENLEKTLQAGLEPKQFIPILTAYLILIN
ncbi:hypothetical protein OGM63_14640 [Plectonema radiosum NIES-515]|uniref:Uncharacterized protein n=1 Tax=Plectonema radiosum NIES-515 TaxID=2986073 RepID=A0ABT3B036_9CYAN|nr:hypothetical protein [Plectonema radiosum]MCV3214739.1 hypothetical protein [Plectonema radiosum NIES-515]